VVRSQEDIRQELTGDGLSAWRDDSDSSPGPGLQPIETMALHERAYIHLKKAMMVGHFRPGEVVTLRGVAEALGTSVMPVREAVRRLVSERALEMPTSRSIRVPLMGRERFDDLCRCRVLIEGEASALAAKNLTREDIYELEALDTAIKANVAAGDMAGMLAVNQVFHFAVYRHSGSQLLMGMIESLWLQCGPLLNLLASPRAATVGFEFDNSQHGRLLDALSRKDANEARTAVGKDITENAKLYRSLLKS
jgi:DNA-binding GntR family transcriptional regulator